MRARGNLPTVIRELPGQQQFPDRLIVALEQRISTWFLPMYGFSEAEELGRLDPAALQGVLETGIQAGELAWQGDQAALQAVTPSRALMLAVMQHRGVKLPCFDMVGPKGGPHCAVELVWAALVCHGGARQVGASTAKAKAVAEACRLEKFEAIRVAAKLLEELQPAADMAGATQPADLAAAAGGEDHVAEGSAPAEILPPELLAALSEQPGDLLPMPAPFPQPCLLTP